MLLVWLELDRLGFWLELNKVLGLLSDELEEYIRDWTNN